MSKQIFNVGDVLNKYGITYIAETDPYVWKGKKFRRVKCKCGCGKIFEARLSQIKNNNTTSCGCRKNKIVGNLNKKDLTGQKFNLLTAIKPTDKRSNGKIVWECQCDCGQKCYVSSSHLLSGHTQSCGCKKSRGEERISKILSQLNINYLKEKTFEDCINPKTNYKLKFDFYLPDYNCCIEYDGIQHFDKSFRGNWGNMDDAENLKVRDKIKTDYCSSHNIRLIRIPYTNFDLLDEEYLIKQINSTPIVGSK